MNADPRLVTASREDDDAQYEAGLRPRTLKDYIGQERVRQNLDVSITAARQRGEGWSFMYPQPNPFYLVAAPKDPRERTSHTAARGSSDQRVDTLARMQATRR